MENKKLIAYTALKMKSIGLNKMKPLIDDDWTPQLNVRSNEYTNAEYTILVESHKLKMHLYINDGGNWKPIPVNTSGFYDGNEYNGIKELLNVMGYVYLYDEFIEVSNAIKELNEKYYETEKRNLCEWLDIK